ncbi:MAG: PAS domain S-box protein [Christensenellales bacterium]
MKSSVLNQFDFERASTLLEGFNRATGFVTAILDLDGNILCKSGWRQICTDFHRKHPQASLNCTISDTQMANRAGSGGKYNYYLCMNGLVDIQIPIIVKGEHAANLFSGQFFFEPPDISRFKEQAKAFGFEEQAYLEALRKVPIVSKENVEAAMTFLLQIIQIIIELTVDKMEQTELNEVISRSERTLLENQVQLRRSMEDLLASQRIAHVGTWRLDLATNQVVWSDELYRMYGFDPAVPPPPYTEHMKLFTPESWGKLSNSLELTRTLGIPYELELETITKTGPNGWMWVRGEAEKDAQGNIITLWGAAQDITEHKLIENKLKRSEEKFQLLFSQAPLAYLALDAEARFFEVNQKWLDMFGYLREEVIGKWLGDFLCPEYVEAFRQRFEQFKIRGSVQSEVEIFCKDGRRLLIAFEGKIAYDAKGEFKQTHGIMQDITEQRRMERALIESESRYRQLSEHSRTFTWETDDQGLYTFVDSVSEKVLGYRPEELMGKKHFYDLCPQADREELKRTAFDTFRRKGIFHDLENRALTKEGAPITLSTNGIPLLKEDGSLLGYRGSDTEITARKRAEEALVHSHDLMRYIIEHNRSSVAVLDREMNYLYVSKRYLEDYRIKEADIIGKHHYSIFPNLPPAWIDVHHRALRGEISSAEEEPFAQDDGRMEWIRWECRPWYESDASIGGIILYTEMITDYVNMLEDLQNKENALSEAQKIAHVGSFYYDVASSRVTFSQEGLRIIGLTQEDLAGGSDKVVQLIHPTQREHLLDISLKARDEKRLMQAELRIVRRDGDERIVDYHVGPVFDENGNCVRITGTIQDISDRKKTEEYLLYLNHHDTLTGLYNRRHYETELRRLDAPHQLPLSLIVADINGLKLINDALGDAQGDKIIIESAELLSRCCRKGDLIFRTGGDEFSMLLPRTSATEAAKLLKTIQDAIVQHNRDVSGEIYHLNLSLGTDTKDEESVDFTQIQKKSEVSMNQRKLLEKNSSYSAIISSIKATMMEKSYETEAHAERITLMTRDIGRMLNLSQTELDHLELLATLHDIGKVGIPEQILKKPGRLDADEWAEMKKHPEIGYRIAMSSPTLAPIALYILHHHERWDGLGYPQSLKGTDIPLLSRILAVVDSYDAMTEDRVYKKAMPPEAAIQEIRRCAGTQFDPEVARVFMDVKFPSISCAPSTP